jgi:hypothetical protein
MNGPIYRLSFYNRTALVNGLKDSQKDHLRARHSELIEAAGIRQLLLADMAWSGSQYESFGVELAPSLDALQTYTTGLRDLGLRQYVQSESFLGIPLDETANQIDPPAGPCEGDSPVYRVYLSRLTAKGYTLTTDELNQINAWANQGARSEGGQLLVSAYCRWNNEQWEYFGVERFPCIEALLRYTQYLSVSNWYSIWRSRSHLGTALNESLTF